MLFLVGLVLLLLSALFSGLTIGFMSLDLTTLKRMAKHGDKNAHAILSVRADSMLLLTTLLLGNAAVNSSFAILVGNNLTGLIAGTLSTVLIFIFGEVFPQAVLSRHALSFGARSAPFIRVLMWVTYPVCAPIAWVLTQFLGEEVARVYTKKDILSIVEEKESHGGELKMDEQRLVRGSLLYSQKKVEDVMTPGTVVTTVEADDVIDREYLEKLKEIDYSRIPVHAGDHNHITGILYYRDLVGRKLPVSVRKAMDTTVHFVHTTDSLDAVLNQFIRTKMHLFVVIDDFGRFEGVITLEDVIEEIIGTEIMDEGDEHADLRQVALDKKETMRKLSKKSTGG
jgi:metal transporter CNNM